MRKIIQLFLLSAGVVWGTCALNAQECRVKGMEASNGSVLGLMTQEEARALSDQECRIASWKCKRCQRSNLEGVSACAFCGKPRHA
jgi:hypothetical protein